jgi:hypothetical protein
VPTLVNTALSCVEFEAILPVSMKNKILWNETPCSLVEVTDASEERNAKLFLLLAAFTLPVLRWKTYVTPKRRQTSAILHGMNVFFTLMSLCGI